MKVYQINTVYNIGSTGCIVAQLKHTIEAQGDECVAAYGRGFSEEKNTFKIGTKSDLYFHALMTRITDKTGFYSKRSTRKLINNIIQFNPDIIHLHNLHGYYLNIEVLFEFLKEYDRPIVWTLHDCWSFTGHCAYYSAKGCDKWKSLCQGCPQCRSYPSSYLADNSKNNFLKKREWFTTIAKMIIVTPSFWLKEEVEQSFLGKYGIQCIYNGIDTSVFKPTRGNLRKQYNLENKKIILGVASIWSERKGIYDFAKLAEILPDEYQIVMVGVDRKQAKTMSPNIICIEKFVSQKVLASLYTEADVYFNASVEETMGLTTIEAMACGTPVVVYNKTAIPEVVDEKVGRVVEQGNIEDVKLAIEDILLKENCVEICVQYAKKYCMEKQYGEYMDLYKKVCSIEQSTKTKMK